MSKSKNPSAEIVKRIETGILFDSDYEFLINMSKALAAFFIRKGSKDPHAPLTALEKKITLSFVDIINIVYEFWVSGDYGTN